MLNARIVYAQQNAAVEAIALARQQLVICLEAAAETELAGANVASLAVVLNDAGDLLSKAELAHSTGDFTVAADYAVACSERLDGFLAESTELQILEQEHGLYFLVGLAASIFGFFVVIIIGFCVWVYLAQRYREVEK